MKANMGMMDRAVRLLLVAGIVALYMFKVISGAQALVLGILAAILLLTCFTGFCPLYLPFKISTTGKSSGKPEK